MIRVRFIDHIITNVEAEDKLSANGSLVAVATIGAVVRNTYSEEFPVVPEAGIVIPFDWVTNHIVVQAQVNNSRPLSFVFDTGDRYAVIEMKWAVLVGR
jgi:hypothetical protein